MIESFGISDDGCVRQQNEDRILMDHSLLLFAVADGMGGHHGGALAAELVISSLRFSMLSSQDRVDVTWPFGYNFELSIDANRLVTAVQVANRQVWRQAESAPQTSGMGSTVAALLLSGRRAVIANAGDSRVYLFRERALQQLSFDHTFLNTSVPAGHLQPDQIRSHPMRNVLTQAAGARGDLDVYLHEQPLESGDLFLLSSDGLHGPVEEHAMISILCGDETLEHKAGRLLQAARRNGGPDNISCILIAYSA